MRLGSRGQLPGRQEPSLTRMSHPAFERRARMIGPAEQERQSHNGHVVDLNVIRFVSHSMVARLLPDWGRWADALCRSQAGRNKVFLSMHIRNRVSRILENAPKDDANAGICAAQAKHTVCRTPRGRSPRRGRESYDLSRSTSPRSRTANAILSSRRTASTKERPPGCVIRGSDIGYWNVSLATNGVRMNARGHRQTLSPDLAASRPSES